MISPLKTNSISTNSSLKIDETIPIMEADELQTYMENSQITELQKKLLQFPADVKSCEEEREQLIFQITKLKCEDGFFTKNWYKNKKTSDEISCNVVRQGIQKSLEEFAPNYCIIVFNGIETINNWALFSNIKDQEMSFKIRTEFYSIHVYKTYIDLQQIEDNASTTTTTSEEEKESESTTPLKDSSTNSSSRKSSIQYLQRQNRRGSQKSLSQHSQQKENGLFLKKQQSNTNISGVLEPSSKANQTPNFKKRMSVQNSMFMNSSQSNEKKHQVKSYLQKQREADQLRQKQQQALLERYKSTIIHPENISREQIVSICKQYKKFVKEIPTKTLNCQEYCLAIEKAFKANKIIPKLIIVKREPQGDHFWDYHCDSESSYHSWSLINKDKNGQKCVVVAL